MNVLPRTKLNFAPSRPRRTIVTRKHWTPKAKAVHQEASVGVNRVLTIVICVHLDNRCTIYNLKNISSQFCKNVLKTMLKTFSIHLAHLVVGTLGFASLLTTDARDLVDKVVSVDLTLEVDPTQALSLARAR